MDHKAVLVINCGSSSIKFAVLKATDGATLASGLAERLLADGATLKAKGPSGEVVRPLAENTHKAAVREILAVLEELGVPRAWVGAVGHRVVHGGEFFKESALINATTLEAVRRCSTFAPLHNPANMEGIEATLAVFSDLPQAAVFDTAFHQTMPRAAYLYAIPYELYERDRMRRYGFHGTSHAFVAGEAARRLGKVPATVNVVIAHLGNGCSACAVRGGESVDTTMGLSPLEGLAMGTRSGDVDPDLPRFLSESHGMSIERVSQMLNRESGLLGLSGLSHDMRTLVEAAGAGNERAQIAIEVFVFRVRKAIFAMAASLERLDAVIFTGGIGEHSVAVRGQITEGLGLLGVRLDPECNECSGRDSNGRISRVDSAVSALVVPTNEEWMIARETARLASL